MLTLSALPTELLLEIIPHIPFSPSTLQTLRLTSKPFSRTLHHHEQSLVTAIRTLQHSPATQSHFPSLPHTFAGLCTLHSRLTTLQDLHSHWLRITNHGPDLGWMRDRWESIHKAGMLLLYRLQDCASHEERLDLLNLLPATSLACLVFKLYSSIKILRIYGPEPIHATFCKDDIGARCDVELAFEEMLLLHGPDFFVVMLQAGRAVDGERKTWAVSTLNHEIEAMETRQLHNCAPTLISTVRRAFANKMECHISQNINKMWELLSSTPFDNVDEVTMGRIVLGESLERGERRMGF